MIYCCVSVVILFARIDFEYLKMLNWLWQFCLPSTPDFVTYVDIYLQEKGMLIYLYRSKININSNYIHKINANGKAQNLFA